MRCGGVQRIANAAYLEGFLFPALLRVAPYCVPGGIRVVSNSVRNSGTGAPTLSCGLSWSPSPQASLSSPRVTASKCSSVSLSLSSVSKLKATKRYARSPCARGLRSRRIPPTLSSFPNMECGGLDLDYENGLVHFKDGASMLIPRCKAVLHSCPRWHGSRA